MKSWLKLIRPPNLVTVPGDPLAGFFLASASSMVSAADDIWRVISCLISALFLYIAGLMLNDYADTEEDSKMRPDRPIPSGSVSRRSVLLVSVVLLACGVGAAASVGVLALSVASSLALLIVLYNFVARCVPLLGIVTMGLCRGFSLLLGSAVTGKLTIAAIIAALGVTLYIMAVSIVAIREAEGKVAKGARWLPATALIFMFCLVNYGVGFLVPVSIVMSLLAIIWAVLRGMSLAQAKSPDMISKEVGLLLRCQLLIQASFCSFAGMPGIIVAACLLLMWPVATMLARKYYAS